MADAYEYMKSAQAKYDKTHTTYIGLRLETDKDNDIFQAIKDKPVQTEIKRLVRLALNKFE
ncbi:MAG: hypothetical protein IJ423_02625 [Clostridia bacterium]|nr:hypothetical protein [Clostridia bacterium]